jgi:hypothetical protein
MHSFFHRCGKEVRSAPTTDARVDGDSFGKPAGNAAASAAQLVLVHGRRTGDTVSGVLVLGLIAIVILAAMPCR